MPSQKTPSKPVIEIIKMPRKELDFFKAGQLYKFRFNDPYRFKIRYSVLDVKQMDSIKESHDARQTMPNTFLSHLTKKFNINFVIVPSTQLYNSYLLNDTFICLESNGILLRNFRSEFDGRKVDVAVIKQVPVFLFHDVKNQKPIIGSVQIDLNKQNLDELFMERKNEVVTPDNLVYIENLFEEVAV